MVAVAVRPLSLRLQLVIIKQKHNCVRSKCGSPWLEIKNYSGGPKPKKKEQNFLQSLTHTRSVYKVNER